MGHRCQHWPPVDECFLLESTSASDISATRYKQTTHKITVLESLSTPHISAKLKICCDLFSATFARRRLHYKIYVKMAACWPL